MAAADNFCGRCGQENHTHKLPVGHFLLELLSGLFNFDTKLLRTLRDLFVPPGLVIHEFNANKRARYVHPLRLYLFTSLIFFLLLAWTTSRLEKEEQQSMEVGSEVEPSESQGGLSLELGEGKELSDSTLQSLVSRPVLMDADIDSTLIANGISAGFWERVIVRIVMNVSASANTSRKAAYVQNLLAAFSKLMFVLLPLFALILHLLHIRRGLFYTEHLVFALYFHSVLYMLIALQLGLGTLSSSFGLVQLPFYLALIYLFWAMRTVYERSWPKTFLKTLVLVALYMILLVLGFAASAVIGVL